MEITQNVQFVVQNVLSCTPLKPCQCNMSFFVIRCFTFLARFLLLTFPFYSRRKVDIDPENAVKPFFARKSPI